MSSASVALVQARPIYYDLPRTLEKTLDLIHAAHTSGTKLIVFGETWLPGYPAWLDVCPNVALWGHPPTKQVYARLFENSVSIESDAVAQLINIARQLDIVLVIGINEKVLSGSGNRTLYNSILTIDRHGIRNHHRKLRPTYTERLVWGQGDGAGLEAIATDFGRVGSLICWEHWMPLARQALHNSGEDIHIALWPSVKEMHQIASRHYAFEGRCFVLAVGSIMLGEDLPDALEKPADITPQSPLLFGGSCVIAPDGSFIIPPLNNEETIITAELDLSQIVQEQMTLDVSGHYHRPDVFSFDVKRER